MTTDTNEVTIKGAAAERSPILPHALPRVPELPPGYRVAHVDAEGGWLVGDTNAWFDDDYGELQSTRVDAVALAWDHWLNYVASDEWREFIAQHKDRLFEMEETRDE